MKGNGVLNFNGSVDCAFTTLMPKPTITTRSAIAFVFITSSCCSLESLETCAHYATVGFFHQCTGDKSKGKRRYPAKLRERRRLVSAIYKGLVGRSRRERFPEAPRAAPKWERNSYESNRC